MRRLRKIVLNNFLTCWPNYTFVDGEAAVHVGVVDVALPAHGGARFFEVDPHDDQQVIFQGVGLGLEQVGVGDGLVVVVDGAGPHHHDEPVVAAVQYVRNRAAAGFDQRLGGRGRWQPFFEQGGCEQRAHRADAQVVDAGGVVGGQRGGGGVNVWGHGVEGGASAGSGATECLALSSPVGVVEVVQANLTTGGGRVHETAFADKDAGVEGPAAAEDHQITGADLGLVDRAPKVGELGDGARRRHACAGFVDVTDQPAAVEAAVGRVAAPAVGRADQAQRVDGDVTGLRFGQRRRQAWAPRRGCAGTAGEQQGQSSLGPARSAPGAVNAAYSRAISVVTAALAFHRKWLSAREKIIENGSLQLEIRHLAGPPDRALDGLKI